MEDIKEGKIYFSFDYLKQLFNIPQDALLKHIEANNLEGTVEFSFYTKQENEKFSYPTIANDFLVRYKPELRQ
jgi:hypothetical protein